MKRALLAVSLVMGFGVMAFAADTLLEQDIISNGGNPFINQVIRSAKNYANTSVYYEVDQTTHTARMALADTLINGTNVITIFDWFMSFIRLEPKYNTYGQKMADSDVNIVVANTFTSVAKAHYGVNR